MNLPVTSHALTRDGVEITVYIYICLYIYVHIYARTSHDSLININLPCSLAIFGWPRAWRPHGASHVRWCSIPLLYIDYSRFMYHKPDSMPNLIPTVLIPDGWKGCFFSFRGLLRWATSQAAELGLQPIPKCPKEFLCWFICQYLSVCWWITIHDWFLLKKRSSCQNH